MKKIVFSWLALVGLLVLGGSFAEASEYDYSTRTSAIWVEGGATVGKNVDPGVAVGVRFGYIGLTFGYGGSPDYKSGKVMDVAPVNPAPLLGITSTNIGKKSIDPAFGGDLLFFLDLGRYVTLYAGPGVYYQEYRNLYRIDAITSPVNGWDVGTLYNVEEKKHEVEMAGGAGMQVKIANGSRGSVFITAGYHTIRGVSGGIGLAF